MTGTCEYCGNHFEKRRADARFCNSTCRSKASKMGLGNPGNETPNLFSTHSPGAAMPNPVLANDFLGYIKAENLALKQKLDLLTSENSRLQLENLNLKTEAKVNEKLSELDKAQTNAEKERGLSGVLDTIGSNDRWMDIIESLGSSLVDKLGPQSQEPAILQGMDDSHKQHIEVLIAQLKSDPEFTKKITAIALKTKNTPEVLQEIINYLNAPAAVNGADTLEEEEAQEPVYQTPGTFGMGIFGSA